MNQYKIILFLTIIGILAVGIQYSFAVPSIEISTNKTVYQYGDLLSIIVNVSEITGKPIVLHITDSSGTTSSPISLPINKLNSTITSPLPFYRTTFSPGIYHIDAEYSGVQSNTTFNLINSGIAIPDAFKTVVKTMEQGTPDDKEYAGIIRELINDKIINIPNYNQTNQIYIPFWFKNNIKLWSNDFISDNEFGSSIQYLIQKGIITV